LLIVNDAATDKLTVSVRPTPKADHGEPLLRRDLTMTATAAEFDEGFVAALRGYTVARSSLAEQAAATAEVLAAAKAESASKATKAVSAARTSTAKPVPGKTTAPVIDTDDDSDDDEDAATTTAQSASVAAAPAAQMANTESLFD
jgi:PRTRC genetic system protein E